MNAGGWPHIHAVEMYVAVCPRCSECISASPRVTPEDATADLRAHFHIVHNEEAP